jgi:fluoride exporter
MSAAPDPAPRHRLAEADASAKAGFGPVPSDRSWPFRAWPPRLAAIAAVGLGGIFGANARYRVGLWATDRWGTSFPWGTLLINISGSFVLGFFMTLVTERFTGRPMSRLFVATGFLGAYTTFSAFTYETVRLIQHGELVRAVAYASASLIGGVAAVVAGLVAARAL